VPLIIGSNKTVVSVTTGQTEYHPLYLSIGNIHNSVRRAHRNSVVLIGFLSIPKCRCLLFSLQHCIMTFICLATKEHNNNVKYRNFRRQLFQCSLAKIFESVKPFMETFDVTCFLDGHFRQTVHSLGPYIADYPEQLILSGIMQNWCPRYVTNFYFSFQ
jgi:Plavaka transposase